MASGHATVRIGESVRKMTMVIDIRGVRVFQIRLALAKPLFRLAAWISGFSGVKFEGEEG